MLCCKHAMKSSSFKKLLAKFSKKKCSCNADSEFPDVQPSKSLKSLSQSVNPFTVQKVQNSVIGTKETGSTCPAFKIQVIYENSDGKQIHDNSTESNNLTAEDSKSKITDCLLNIDCSKNSIPCAAKICHSYPEVTVSPLTNPRIYCKDLPKSDFCKKSETNVSIAYKIYTEANKQSTAVLRDAFKPLTNSEARYLPQLKTSMGSVSVSSTRTAGLPTKISQTGVGSCLPPWDEPPLTPVNQQSKLCCSQKKSEFRCISLAENCRKSCSVHYGEEYERPPPYRMCHLGGNSCRKTTNKDNQSATQKNEEKPPRVCKCSKRTKQRSVACCTSPHRYHQPQHHKKTKTRKCQTSKSTHHSPIYQGSSSKQQSSMQQSCCASSKKGCVNYLPEQQEYCLGQVRQNICCEGTPKSCQHCGGFLVKTVGDDIYVQVDDCCCCDGYQCNCNEEEEDCCYDYRIQRYVQPPVRSNFKPCRTYETPTIGMDGRTTYMKSYGPPGTWEEVYVTVCEPKKQRFMLVPQHIDGKIVYTLEERNKNCSEVKRCNCYKY